MHILFLDDEPLRIQIVRGCDTITYVRNKAEFMAYLLSNPLPDVICYDFDLADKTGITGENIARWAVDHNYVAQITVIHSWNPIGAQRIVDVHEGTGTQIYMRPFTAYKLLFEK